MKKTLFLLSVLCLLFSSYNSKAEGWCNVNNDGQESGSGDCYAANGDQRNGGILVNPSSGVYISFVATFGAEDIAHNAYDYISWYTTNPFLSGSTYFFWNSPSTDANIYDPYASYGYATYYSYTQGMYSYASVSISW